MRHLRGSMLAEALTAAFLAVIFSLCVASLLRVSVMLVSTSYELLETERTVQAVLSHLNSGSLPETGSLGALTLRTEEPSPESGYIILTVEKQGYLKARSARIVWPKAEL